MEKIVAVTFDIADQKCKQYNALEWVNFILDTREYLADGGEPADLTLEELFDEYYGDEFWWETVPPTIALYQAAFDLRSEQFIYCVGDHDCEAIMAMVEETGDEEEIFWAE
jgi:hypothetical protein